MAQISEQNVEGSNLSYESDKYSARSNKYRTDTERPLIQVTDPKSDEHFTEIKPSFLLPPLLLKPLSLQAPYVFNSNITEETSQLSSSQARPDSLQLEESQVDKDEQLHSIAR